MSTRLSRPEKIESPARASDKVGRRWRWLVTALLILSMVVTTAYVVVVGYGATQLANVARLPLHTDPTHYGLQYQNVSFTSREDHVQLVGWFIPGILPDKSLTTQRTIIMVHGYPGNRGTESVGILDIANQFVRHGFAVLTFDLRAAGKSAPAPESMGYFEQRDVLGAVDFLQSGSLPYPGLGRPRVIAGWGVSMGGATLLLAASREPTIRAVVSDCAYSDVLPILQRDMPTTSHLPPMFTPGLILAAQVIYGMVLPDVRPVDVVKNLVPRPVLFIQDEGDKKVPPVDMEILAQAARSAPGAHVETWMIAGKVGHAKSFLKMRDVYINRLIAFYTAALGPNV